VARTHRFDFLPETREVREGDWRVAAAPADLRNRRAEITGPTERKMTINALNSGAQVWLADLEDANTPHWRNVIGGQLNLYDAVRREISLTSADGKEYTLREDGRLATIVVRPRGWHLDEAHLTVDGTPAVGALVDFGLYFFHNARELLDRRSGPYFYLPKMESHREARLCNARTRSRTTPPSRSIRRRARPPRRPGCGAAAPPGTAFGVGLRGKAIPVADVQFGGGKCDDLPADAQPGRQRRRLTGRDGAVSPASPSAVPVTQPALEFGGDDALVMHAGCVVGRQPDDGWAHHCGLQEPAAFGHGVGGQHPRDGCAAGQ
jgi:hypothetical protein